MKRKDKSVIWPIYFDSTKTRKEGRRIAKNLAVPIPKILEIKKVADNIGLSYNLISDASYPKTPWLITGRLDIVNNKSKHNMIKTIARKLLDFRRVNLKK